MKAMVLERIAPMETSPLRLAEVPMPEPGPGEVRMKVHCCGVCRTDLHVIEGDLPQQKMPVIPGHQIVGTVDKLGPGCRAAASVATDRARLAPLDLRPVPVLHHGARKPLRVGPLHRLSGRRRLRRVRRRARGVRLRDSRPHSATSKPLRCSCAGIIGYRALKRSQLPPGGRLAMYGFGSSAHVLIQIARHRGCEVYVVTRDEKHRELARQMGAVWVGADRPEMPIKVDSAIVFAPAGELVPPALEKLEKGGTLALAGIYMTPIPAMDYERYVFYERDIHSVTSNTRQDGRELLAEAAADPRPPAHDRLSAGRGQSGACRPQARSHQRHGGAKDKR